MEGYGHKIDKYALIVTAANEIQAHLEEYENDVTSRQSFHLVHIEKAATFIKFIEDVCILPGSELFDGKMLSGLWRHVVDNVYDENINATIKNLPITKVVHRYQSEINGKFNNLTAPF